MIAPDTVTEVRCLLAEGGHSQRKIARLTGVSRGTVAAIASGRRTEREKQSEEDLERPVGPPRRCPGCGGMVLMPCLACRDRKATGGRREAGGRRKNVSRLRPPAYRLQSGLDLRPEHFTRYLHVRRQRLHNSGRPVQGAYE